MTLCYLESKICCCQTKAIIISLWVKSKNSRSHISLHIISPPLYRPKDHITLTGSYEYYPVKWKNNWILNWKTMSINKHRLLLLIFSHGASGMIAWLFLSYENKVRCNASNILFADSSHLLLIKLKKPALDHLAVRSGFMCARKSIVLAATFACTVSVSGPEIRVEHESCMNPCNCLAETFYLYEQYEISTSSLTDKLYYNERRML